MSFAGHTFSPAAHAYPRQAFLSHGPPVIQTFLCISSSGCWEKLYKELGLSALPDFFLLPGVTEMTASTPGAKLDEEAALRLEAKE